MAQKCLYTHGLKKSLHAIFLPKGVYFRIDYPKNQQKMIEFSGIRFKEFVAGLDQLKKALLSESD